MAPPDRSAHGRPPGAGTWKPVSSETAHGTAMPGERRRAEDRRVRFDRREMIRFDDDRRSSFDRRAGSDPWSVRIGST